MIKRFADWLLKKLCHPDYYTDIRGDLEEINNRLVNRHTKLAVEVLYLKEVLALLRPPLTKPLLKNHNNSFMLLNHLKLALRQLTAHKSYSLINILGLSLGFTCSIVIALFVINELSFDQHHLKQRNTYRLELNIKSGSAVNHYVSSVPAAGPAMVSELPEVANFVRLRRGNSGGGDLQFLAYGDKGFFHEITYADSTFFEVFDFELKSGNPRRSLTYPNSVVISEDVAVKFFGDADPMGKQLELDNEHILEVTGVLAKPDKNSHLNPNILVAMSGFEPPTYADLNSWGWFTFYTYLVLEKGADVALLNEKMQNLIAKNTSAEASERMSFTLMPLEDIYLHSYSDGVGIGAVSSIIYSQILTVVGVIVLFISCFNYVNLFTARSSKRFKEIGIRKILGSSKREILFQLLVEAMLTITLSAFIAVGVIALGYQSLDQFMGTTLLIPTDKWTSLILVSLLLVGLIGLASGIYPALLLSKFQPLKALKGSGKQAGSKSLLRMLLLTFQFGVAIILLVATFTVQEQLNYLRAKDLGFNKDQVLIMPLRNDLMRAQYNSLKNEIESNSVIHKVGAARLGLEGLHGSYRVISQEPDADPTGTQMAIYPVNYDFIEALDIEITAGRSYDRSYNLDTTYQFIINQSAKSILGWDDPVGKKIMLNGQGGMYGEIVGVAENFHFKTLTNEIEPMVMFLRENASNYVYVKASNSNPGELIGIIENAWQTVLPSYPFEYQFLDDRINNIYEKDSKFGALINLFSAIAVFITCIGLFGLVTYMISQKLKEVAVRKVLGASIGSIFLLLTKALMALILIAALVGMPIAYFGTREWLNSYAYRISPDVMIYLIALISIFVLSLLTVSKEIIKATLCNPAIILRNE
ncbi:MAG: ABC transporter permease [Cyclobacteriaceae bacterium]